MVSITDEGENRAATWLFDDDRDFRRIGADLLRIAVVCGCATTA
jgi:hypothetical protein